jgi:hypothetical protein
MATEHVMIPVHPVTKGRVKERRGERTYNDYVLHLLELEDGTGS